MLDHAVAAFPTRHRLGSPEVVSMDRPRFIRPKFCVSVLCLVVFSLNSYASASWKESVIYSFQGGDADGETPVGGIVFDRAGNLYGATSAGGGTNCAPIS